jgi:transposase
MLGFLTDFNMPFDREVCSSEKNLAERDLRVAKVRHKVSGCFRSRRRAEIVCHIRGRAQCVSTMHKQGQGILEALNSIVANQAPPVSGLISHEDNKMQKYTQNVL